LRQGAKIKRRGIRGGFKGEGKLPAPRV